MLYCRFCNPFGEPLDREGRFCRPILVNKFKSKGIPIDVRRVPRNPYLFSLLVWCQFVIVWTTQISDRSPTKCPECCVITRTNKYDQIKPFLKQLQWLPVNQRIKYIKDITWSREETNFIFECWKYLSRVSEANLWEILSAREGKIRIPKRLCNVLCIFIDTDEIPT